MSEAGPGGQRVDGRLRGSKIVSCEERLATRVLQRASRITRAQGIDASKNEVETFQRVGAKRNVDQPAQGAPSVAVVGTRRCLVDDLTVVATSREELLRAKVRLAQQKGSIRLLRLGNTALQTQLDDLVQLVDGAVVIFRS